MAALRDARDRQQQEMVANQQMAELMKNAGANAKNLSETKVGNGNALELVMAGMGGAA